MRNASWTHRDTSWTYGDQSSKCFVNFRMTFNRREARCETLSIFRPHSFVGLNLFQSQSLTRSDWEYAPVGSQSELEETSLWSWAHFIGPHIESALIAPRPRAGAALM